MSPQELEAKYPGIPTYEEYVRGIPHQPLVEQQQKQQQQQGEVSVSSLPDVQVEGVTQ